MWESIKNPLVKNHKMEDLSYKCVDLVNAPQQGLVPLKLTNLNNQTLVGHKSYHRLAQLWVFSGVVGARFLKKLELDTLIEGMELIGDDLEVHQQYQGVQKLLYWDDSEVKLVDGLLDYIEDEEEDRDEKAHIDLVKEWAGEYDINISGYVKLPSKKDPQSIMPWINVNLWNTQSDVVTVNLHNLLYGKEEKPSEDFPRMMKDPEFAGFMTDMWKVWEQQRDYKIIDEEFKIRLKVFKRAEKETDDERTNTQKLRDAEWTAYSKKFNLLMTKSASARKRGLAHLISSKGLAYEFDVSNKGYYDMIMKGTLDLDDFNTKLNNLALKEIEVSGNYDANILDRPTPITHKEMISEIQKCVGSPDSLKTTLTTISENIVKILNIRKSEPLGFGEGSINRADLATAVLVSDKKDEKAKEPASKTREELLAIARKQLAEWGIDE